MSVRHATFRALSVLAVLAAGCRESLSPFAVAGTYVLERVGDAPVPTVIFTDSRGTVRVIADTLVLGADGRGRFISVQTIEPEGASGPGAPMRVESDLRFDIVGSMVEITYVCPPSALCLAGPHLIARRRSLWLIVEETLASDALRYYRRAGSLPSG